MKDKLEKRISSYRNKTRNVSMEVSTSLTILKTIPITVLIMTYDSTIDLDNNDTVAGVIWKTLTPRSKGKVKTNLKNQILPRGFILCCQKSC